MEYGVVQVRDTGQGAQASALYIQLRRDHKEINMQKLKQNKLNLM